MELAEPADWPDFSSATITEASPINALWRAIAERCAVAHADFSLGVDYGASRYDPALQRLIGIRATLCSIASNFVRLYDDSYQWMSWAEFPKTYSANDLLTGEHSLAVIPPRAAPDANAEQLSMYRTFLANCAWWIRQFRYVDASDTSYFTRKATASGSVSIRDFNGSGVHDRSGSEPELILESPAITQADASDKWPLVNRVRSRLCMFSYLHEDEESYEDSLASGSWINDDSRQQYRAIDATAYSGLVVRNFSGLDARLLLVSCYQGGKSYPMCTENLTYIDTLIPATGPDGAIPEMAGIWQHVESVKDLHGSEWRERLKVQVDHDQHWRVDGGDLIVAQDNTRLRTEKTWSLDGSRCHAVSSSLQSSGGYNYTKSDDTETRLYIFDGFGEFELGAVVAAGVVPAHGRIVALEERNDMPVPDIWDLTQYRKWRRAHPRSTIDRVVCRSFLRITPILDYNSSYLYRGDEEQSE